MAVSESPCVILSCMCSIVTVDLLYLAPFRVYGDLKVETLFPTYPDLMLFFGVILSEFQD